jgi:CheY-like chemotaxis protein
MPGSGEVTFHIPSHWRVFVLDDTEERLCWFRERVPKMRSAKTAEAAIQILAAEQFDLIFLDHDLSWEDAGFPDRQHGNGKEVARFLARTGFAGRVVIHSKNEDGVRAMARLLPAATIERFGDFDITESSSAAGI